MISEKAQKLFLLKNVSHKIMGHIPIHKHLDPVTNI